MIRNAEQAPNVDTMGNGDGTVKRSCSNTLFALIVQRLDVIRLQRTFTIS